MSLRSHVPPNEIQRFDLAAEHAGERPAPAPRDPPHDLALAGLVPPQPAVFAILAAVRGLHISAEISAVDFRPFALAADRGPASPGSPFSPAPVSQHKR